jgi:thymidylate synthase
MFHLKTESINEGYRQIIDALLEKGEMTAPRGLVTRELHPFCWEITNPRKRSCEIIGRWKNTGFQLAECLWMLDGRDDLETLNHYVPNYTRFSDDTTTLSGAYGKRIKDWNGINQFQTAFEKLMKDPNSRQAVIVIWNPEKDNLTTNDPPCTNWFHLTIRNSKLDWTTVMRGNDVLWGTPYNLFNFMTMQEMIAGWLGIDVGTYTHFVDCMHIYEERLDVVKRIVSQEHNNIDVYDFIKPLDSRLAKFVSEHTIRKLAVVQKILLRHPYTAKDRQDALAIVDVLPWGYWRSIGYTLLVCEDIRFGQTKQALEILGNISNEFQVAIAQQICRLLFRQGTDPRSVKELWKVIEKYPKKLQKFVMENPLKEMESLEVMS